MSRLPTPFGKWGVETSRSSPRARFHTSGLQFAELHCEFSNREVSKRHELNDFLNYLVNTKINKVWGAHRSVAGDVGQPFVSRQQVETSGATSGVQGSWDQPIILWLLGFWFFFWKGGTMERFSSFIPLLPRAGIPWEDTRSSPNRSLMGKKCDIQGLGYMRQPWKSNHAALGKSKEATAECHILNESEKAIRAPCYGSSKEHPSLRSVYPCTDTAAESAASADKFTS